MRTRWFASHKMGRQRGDRKAAPDHACKSGGVASAVKAAMASPSGMTF